MAFIPLASKLTGGDKVNLLNTIGIWIVAIVLIFAYFFREDPNKLNTATVNQLVSAVDNFAKVSDEIAKAAISQRQWAAGLERQLVVNNQLLKRGYKDIYETYGYNDSDSASPLDDLYAEQLRISTQSDRSGNLRGDEN